MPNQSCLTLPILLHYALRVLWCSVYCHLYLSCHTCFACPIIDALSFHSCLLLHVWPCASCNTLPVILSLYCLVCSVLSDLDCNVCSVLSPLIYSKIPILRSALSCLSQPSLYCTKHVSFQPGSFQWCLPCYGIRHILFPLVHPNWSC